MIVTDINKAINAGATLQRSCNVVGINTSTFWRWHKAGTLSEDKRATAFRPAPKSKLSPCEEQTVLDICCQKEYADLPPTQIVPLLLDKGYLAWL